jgi:hypothetical protein
LNPATRSGENQSSHAGDGRGSSVAKMSSALCMSWRALPVFPNRVSTSASTASSHARISGDADARLANAQAARILLRASSARFVSPEKAGINAMCASTAEPRTTSWASCAAWSAITKLACAFAGFCSSKNSMRPASRLDSLTAAAREHGEHAGPHEQHDQVRPGPGPSPQHGRRQHRRRAPPLIAAKAAISARSGC